MENIDANYDNFKREHCWTNKKRHQKGFVKIFKMKLILKDGYDYKKSLMYDFNR